MCIVLGVISEFVFVGCIFVSWFLFPSLWPGFLEADLISISDPVRNLCPSWGAGLLELVWILVQLVG